MNATTVALLSMLAVLPVFAGETPRNPDRAPEIAPTASHTPMTQPSADPAFFRSPLRPQTTETGLRSELNWSNWAYVTGSRDLMYRSADDPVRGGCGYLEFRGAAGKTCHVDVYAHEYGNPYPSKQTLAVYIDLVGRFATRTWAACICPEGVSLAD